MTTVIDERVVEMRFNNEDFEKNVAQSMSTLEKLKASLNFDSAKSLEELGKASKNFSLAGITDTITEATTKFSALEIAGVTALMNITNKAVDLGISLTKSLSIDQVTSGFDKYAVKTQSVQTIMSATSDQFENQAEQMEYVNEQLDKLTWFTDETSYSMTDMTSNIGKFVSNNIKLDEAVTAMEGIATWAGLSGAGVTEASRAMYNFSQAMGAGAMKLQDWKSIENANMATTKFKQTAIDTAVELGKLTKSADGLVTTLDGKAEVSITSFSESLKKKWFDTEVMTQTLGKFGKFSDELYNLSDATNLTASELLEALDEYKAGSLDLNEIAKDSTMSITDLNEKFKELTGEGFELGRKAFAASQEAKTFKEAIDSVTDAVSSGWMNTFEILFGNYLEAKALWTGLANNMYDLFAEGGNKRNEVLKVWKELGGRNSLIKGAVNALNLLIKPLTVVREAFESMLPKGRDFGKLLNQLTYKFMTFTSRIQPSQKLLNNLYQFFRGIFSVGKVFLQFMSQLINAFVKLVSPAKSVIELIGDFLGKAGLIMQVVSVFISETGLIQTAVSFIVLGIQKLAGIIKSVAIIFGGALFTGIQVFIGLIIKATTAVKNFISVAGNKLVSIGNSISSAFSKVTGIFSKFKKSTDDTTKSVGKLEKKYGAASKVVGSFGTVVNESGFAVAKEPTLINRFIDALNRLKSVVVTIATVIGGAFVTLGKKIFDFFTDVKQRYKDITASATRWQDYFIGIFKTIESLLADGWEKVKDFFAQFDIDLSTLETAFSTIKTALVDIIEYLGPGRIAAFGFATAMLALVGAAIKLSDAFTSMFGAVSGVFNNINKILKKQFSKTSVITDLAKAFAIIAGSLTVLAMVDATYHKNLENVSKIMLKLMIAFTACAAALRGLDLLLSKFSIDTDFNLINSNILALAGSMTLLAAAFAILNFVDLKEDWLKRLMIMAAMFGEIVVAATLLSKFAPQLSKGSFLLLSLALSMKLMVDALSTIGAHELDGVNKNMAAFTVLFMGVAALTAAAGKLKLTSAVNLLLIAKALTILMPQIQTMLKEIAPILSDMCDRLEGIAFDFTKLKELAKKAFDKANEFFNYLYTRFSETTATALSLTTMILGTIAGVASLAAVIAGGFALAKIIAAIGSLGNILKGAGIAVIGLAIAIKIVISSIKELGDYVKDLSDEQYKRITDALGWITITLAAVMSVATIMDAVATYITKNHIYDGKTMRTNFFGLAAAFVGLGVAIKLIVASLKGIENIDEGRFASVIGAMSALILCLGIAAGLSGMITKGGAALVGLIGIAVTMALLIAELGVLSAMWSPENMDQMFLGLLSITALFLELSLVLMQLAKLKTGPMLAIMVPLLGIIVALTGLIITLGAIENLNYGGIIIGLAGIAAILMAMGRLMRYIVELPGLGGGRGLKHKIDLLKACVIALGGVVAAVGIMAAAGRFLGGYALLKGLGGLLGGIILIGTIFSYITKVRALSETDLDSKLRLLGSSILALAGVAVILGGFTAVMNKVGSSNVAASFVLLSAQLMAVAGIMWFISNKVKDMTGNETVQKILLLGACIGALAVVAAELTKLSQQEIDDNWNSLFVLSGGLAALTGVMYAISTFTASADWKQIGGTVALVASACAMVWMIATQLSKLSEIDTASLDAAVSALQGFAEAFGQMAVILGVIHAVLITLVGVFTGGTGGAAGIFALPALFLSLGIAAIALGYGFALAADGVRAIGDAFSDVASSLETMSGLNLGSIAEGLLELAVAGGALGAAAGSVEAFAGAMNGLAGALSAYNSAIGGGSGGGGTKTYGGVTFEYFDKAEQATTQSINNQKDTIEKYVKETPKNYEEMVVDCETAVLENTPKVNDAVKDLMNTPWEDLSQFEQAVRQAGYHTVDEYIKAIDEGAEKIDLSKPKGMVEQALTDMTEKGKDTVRSSLGQAGDSITGFLGSLSPIFANSGTLLGSIFGGNIVNAAMQYISKLQGSFDWMFNQSVKVAGKNIAQYGASGMPTDVINKMYGGNAISKQAQALLDPLKAAKEFAGWASGDFLGLNDILDETKKAFEGAGAGATDFGDAASGAGKKAKEAADDMKSSLVDTLSSQLDMFSKFEIKTEMSSQTLLENMKSNIDGFASWSHRMTVLAERFAEHGISDTLYKKLAEMGPKGYETMNAIYQMTDEEMEKLKEYWETGLTLPEGQADIVASGYQYMGEMAADGFSNALDEHKAAHAGSQFGKAALKGIAEALDVHSPSKATEKIGQYAVEGLANGIDSVYGQGILYFAIKHVTEYILEMFNENLSEDVMAEAGSGILTNLFTGLLGEATEENPVMAAFIETFTEFELIDEAINEFVDHLKELLYELFEIGGDEEPSEWFKRYAMSMMQGMIDSFIENEVLVRAQIIIFCTHIIETFDEQDLPQQAKDIGMNIALGLRDGINEYAQEAIDAAEDMALQVIAILESIPNINSPSKVTREIGRYISQGLAIGIEDGADNVYGAARSVAEGAIDAMSDFGRLQEIISEDMDLNPIITPMLDLSLIREQMAELDGYMNDPTYGLEGQNGGASATTPSQINFTQNNYSPKSLSRYDIYRQTRNQLTQLKGALG